MPKVLQAKLHDNLATKCYHCGQPFLELTKDGQECPFCGWVRYLSNQTLDKLMRKRHSRIIV